MELISLACNHCGAPLRVADKARFVTCNHCGAHLQIQRGESAAWTEVVERLQEGQESVDRRLAAIEIENELARLDRAWDSEREGYQVTTKHGGRQDPSVTASIVGFVAVTIVGLVMAGGISSAGGGGLMLFPVVVIGVAGFAMLNSLSKASQLEAGKQRYLRKRRELLRKLEDLRGSSD